MVVTLQPLSALIWSHREGLLSTPTVSVAVVVAFVLVIAERNGISFNYTFE